MKTMGKQKAKSHTSKQITRKQKEWADKVLADKHISLTQAAREVYSRPDHEITRGTASQIATQNNKSKAVRAYLAEHSEDAAERLTRLTQLTDSEKMGEKRLGYDAITQVLDRTEGKPTQSVQSTSVNINIDSVLEGLE